VVPRRRFPTPSTKARLKHVVKPLENQLMMELQQSHEVYNLGAAVTPSRRTPSQGPSDVIYLEVLDQGGEF